MLFQRCCNGVKRIAIQAGGPHSLLSVITKRTLWTRTNGFRKISKSHILVQLNHRPQPNTAKAFFDEYEICKLKIERGESNYTHLWLHLYTESVFFCSSPLVGLMLKRTPLRRVPTNEFNKCNCELFKCKHFLGAKELC